MEDNNSTENHFMEKKENGGGLSDETLNVFRQFMEMAAVTSIHPGLELECSICLDTIFRPHLMAGCNHIFCEPCLIPLFRASKNTVSGPRCPLCRANITETYLLREVDETLMKYFHEKCQNRLVMEKDLMVPDYREDFDGFEVERSQDGKFEVYDVFDFDQNSKNERNLCLKAVLSSFQH